MAINFYSDIHLGANKLGRDADNLLDFSTDNEITFRVGAGDGVVFKASGEIEATKFDGALEGNADTATALATARNIGGQSFDGTGDIVLPGVNAEGNQNTSGRALHVYVADNESTNEENLITFVENGQTGTGGHGLEMDGDLTYNPSTGTLTTTILDANRKLNVTSSTHFEAKGDIVYLGGGSTTQAVSYTHLTLPTKRIV